MDIKAPSIDRRVGRMESTDIRDVARQAALRTAPRVQTILRASARRVGGTALANAVEVHDGHTNDLVQHEAGHPQDVLVGVDGAHVLAHEADALEWGDGQDQNPTQWVAGAARASARTIAGLWSEQLTRELDRRCR